MELTSEGDTILGAASDSAKRRRMNESLLRSSSGTQWMRKQREMPFRLPSIVSGRRLIQESLMLGQGEKAAILTTASLICADIVYPKPY